MELLKCVHLEKSYGNKKVLNDINLTIPRGKIIGLLGIVKFISFKTFLFP